MMSRIRLINVAMLLVIAGAQSDGQEMKTAPIIPPTAKIRYGNAAQQFAELRLPKGKGPFPVVALLHGGCWIGYAGLEDMAPLSTALAHAGFATWNVEYRRGHEPGGGWPGTFDDAEQGVKALKDAATKFPLDVSHFVVVGHSAGGQLALYVGSRLKRPSISLAGIVDMRAYADLSRNQCVDGELKVMGGTPAQYPDRYAKVSPAQLLPLGIPQILIWGERDTIVPETFFKNYEELLAHDGTDAIRTDK